MANDVTTTPKGEMQNALGAAASVLSIMPTVKMTMAKKVNILTNAKSLAKTRDAAEKEELVVDCVGMAVSPVELTTDDGEVVSGLSGIVVSKSGEAFYTQSQPLMRSLGQLVAVMGDPRDWKSSVKLRFRLRKAGDRMVNSMEVME